MWASQEQTRYRRLKNIEGRAVIKALCKYNIKTKPSFITYLNDPVWMEIIFMMGPRDVIFGRY